MREHSQTPVQIAVLAALALPIILYGIRIIGSSSDQIRRYHHEMAAFERELQHGLESLGEVVLSASRLNQDNRIPAFNQQAGELLSQDRISMNRSVALIESQDAISKSNCQINWETSPGRLLLHYKVDWPIGSPADQDDVRLRYSGAIRADKVLEESRKVTNFDALLVADEDGNLVQKSGPDAEYFSALPSFGGDEWKKSFEGSRDKDDPASAFLPTAASVKRDIAGRNYTIFPREIVLRPGLLDQPPLFCAAKTDGQETITLRVVGLVDTKRLTVIAARPSEILYWCIVFFYCLITFLFIEINRPYKSEVVDRRFNRRPWRVANQLGWVNIIGFGLALGIFLAASQKIYSYQARVDRTLRIAGLESAEKALARLDLLRRSIDLPDAKWKFADPWPPFRERCPGLARCAQIDLDGWMKTYRFGSTDLQNRNLAEREYFQRALDTNNFVVDSIVSRASGLREIVVARKVPFRDGKEVRSITSGLLTLQEQKVSARVGIALVDAADSSWTAVLSTESYRQASQDLLKQFSEPDCLRLVIRSHSGGYCSGSLYGQPARLWIRNLENLPMSIQRPGTNRGLVEINHSGSLAVVSYFFQDSFNARLTAALQVAIWFGVFAFLGFNAIILSSALVSKNLPRGPRFDRIASRISKSLASASDPEHKLQRLAYLVFFIAFGLLTMRACWSIEDYWQHRLFGRDMAATTESIAKRCKDAHSSNAYGVEDCITFEEKLLISFDSHYEYRWREPSRLAKECYLALRPTGGRYTEVIPALENITPLERQAAGMLAKPSNLTKAGFETWDLGLTSKLLPSDLQIFLAGREVVAGVLLGLFLLQPTWLLRARSIQAISSNAIAVIAITTIILLFFRQELLAALTGFLATFDKVNIVFDKIWSKLTRGK